MYNLITVIRSRLLVLLTHHLALPVLKLIRKPQVFPFTREQLCSFPDGSLGNDLAKLLELNQFELLTHYAKHDMKHILLDYPTTEEGEVCLQAFMFGNGHVSFPVVSTLVYGWVTMPEYWNSFSAAYRRGQNAIPIECWNWSALVHQNTNELKNVINK